MVIFVIIGALIGAGFASGQEIYLFFYRYGIWGLVGLAICSILIGLIIYKTFCLLLSKNIKDYKGFLDEIFHINNKKSKYLNFSFINNIIINIFLLVTFYIMIAGFGTYFEQEFNVNSFIGATILAMICFVIFLKDIQGVVKASSIVVPILIVCIVIIGVKSLSGINMADIAELNSKINSPSKAIWQSIIYCSYNMILLLPVLVNLQAYIKNKKQITRISVISSIAIFGLALCILSVLESGTANIASINFDCIEMPAVYCISKMFPAFKIIYGIVILLSIFTTAISIGMSFLENISKNKRSYTQFATILCITSVLVSKFGFSNLVKIMFPVFGYLGIVQILFLITSTTSSANIRKHPQTSERISVNICACLT